MFRKTRIRIMLLLTGSLVLLFGIGLSIIVYASYNEIRQSNLENLRRYTKLYHMQENPGNPINRQPSEDPPPPEEKPDYLLSTFYSVAVSKNGEILKTENNDGTIYNSEDLTELALRILAGGETGGQTGTLMYSVDRGRPDFNLVAFIDTTLAQSNLSSLLHSSLISGSVTIEFLFFLAWFVSGRIIKPLEENDFKQRQFISDAGHELKTPVAVISANSEMLYREIGPNEWLTNIQHENKRMGTLVKQLLDLSSAENTAVPMDKTDLSQLVDSEILAFDCLAFEAGKTISSNIEPEIIITGNVLQLQQLVSVLIDNAITYSSGKTIEIQLKRHAHSAVLTVSNEARDLPEQKLNHLFDRFYRIDESRSGNDLHYGLGLAIAKATVIQHRGSVTASFKEGKLFISASLPL